MAGLRATVCLQGKDIESLQSDKRQGDVLQH